MQRILLQQCYFHIHYGRMDQITYHMKDSRMPPNISMNIITKDGICVVAKTLKKLTAPSCWRDFELHNNQFLRNDGQLKS